VLAVQTAQVANTTYLWVYVVIGVVTLAGIVVASARWLKKQGVTEAAVKALIDANLLTRLSDQDRTLAELKKSLSPNGLVGNEVWNIAKRTENKVDLLSTKLDQHIGSSDQTHRDLWRAVRHKDGQ
jgi:hypothetical protein